MDNIPHPHRYSSDDFRRDGMPFVPSTSKDAAERTAHAMEYIAASLLFMRDEIAKSVAMPRPVFPTTHANGMNPQASQQQPQQAQYAQQPSSMPVVRLEAGNRHWVNNMNWDDTKPKH